LLWIIQTPGGLHMMTHHTEVQLSQNWFWGGNTCCYCLPTLEHTAKMNSLILIFFDADYSWVNSIKMQLLFYGLITLLQRESSSKRDLWSLSLAEMFYFKTAGHQEVWHRSHKHFTGPVICQIISYHITFLL